MTVLQNLGWHFEGLITPATVGIYSLIAAIIIWKIRGAPDLTRAKADARKTNAETDGLVIASLSQRLGQVEARLEMVEKENEKLAKEAGDLRDDAKRSRERERDLEQVVRSQKAHIKRVEQRLAGIERIFKLHGVTPAMQKELDKLEQVSISPDGDDPSDSRALSHAKQTKRDTEQADESAQEACEEVARSEKEERDQ